MLGILYISFTQLLIATGVFLKSRKNLFLLKPRVIIQTRTLFVFFSYLRWRQRGYYFFCGVQGCVLSSRFAATGSGEVFNSRNLSWTSEIRVYILLTSCVCHRPGKSGFFARASKITINNGPDSGWGGAA